MDLFSRGDAALALHWQTRTARVLLGGSRGTCVTSCQRWGEGDGLANCGRRRHGSLMLKPLSRWKVKGPVLTVVMDGVGIGQKDESDAVWLARTPTLDRLMAHSSIALRAHGQAVGLPSDKDMGNSEVGHNALGSGRIFDQGATRVQDAIRTGEIFEGRVWKEAIKRVLDANEALHFVGLLSDGNVHSHIDHLIAMLARAREDGVTRARVHVLLDGRDVAETSALEYVARLESVLETHRAAGADYCIASGGGRMTTTMDRYEADWSIVERGYHAHVHGVGRTFRSATEAVEAFRREEPGIIDQYLPEFVIADGEGPVGKMRDGASVIFFNFRGDRAIEFTRAMTESDFGAFERGDAPNVFYAGMMQYDGDLQLPKQFLVSPPSIDETSGELLARAGVPQFACSETQKFGHVTYFWNGNRSGAFDESLERYVEVESDLVPFDERPWMKAAEITDITLAALAEGAERSLRINFANGDMVGHTGHRDATILAVETVDLQLARLWRAVQKLEGALLVTADHGNADQMYEFEKSGEVSLREDGSPKPKTSHSLNQVPFALWIPGQPIRLVGDGTSSIASVATTTLELLGFEAPSDYEPSLLPKD